MAVIRAATGGAITSVPGVDGGGNASNVWVPVMMGIDGNGLPLASSTFTMASNVPLGATTGATPVTGIAGGSYIFSAIFTGTSVALQTLGPDGLTWMALSPPAVLTGSGSMGVVLGNNATVRLYNPNASGLTGVYASLT